MDTEKQCSKCLEVKPLEDFYRAKRLKFGRSYRCKVCQKVYQRKRYTENSEYREAILVRVNKRLEDNPEYDKDFYEANREKILARKRVFREENPDLAKIHSAKFRQTHPEYSRDYYLANKEACNARIKKWREDNPGKRKSHTAKRRAAKLQRTVSWSETEAITEFYVNCSTGMVVDHIIPLQGKEVSGLHVLNNLQYLTPKENGEKSNKLLEEYA